MLTNITPSDRPNAAISLASCVNLLCSRLSQAEMERYIQRLGCIDIFADHMIELVASSKNRLETSSSQVLHGEILYVVDE